MAVAVVSVEHERVVLRAPLGPNINHRETVFGGSASALAILAAWSLLHTRLCSAGMNNRLVIQRNTMEYSLPIFGEFTACATLEQPARWEHFTRMLARRGKARITVLSALDHANQTVGRLTGEFVALSPQITETNEIAALT